MTSEQLAHLLNQPTLLKGVYYNVHRAVCMNQRLWYALTCERGEYAGDDEPVRARDFRHYLEALGLA